MRRMSRYPRAVLAVVCVIAGCGGSGSDPDSRMADWENHFNRVNQATSAGQHDQAIAIGESYLKGYADNVDGHLMIGAAARDAAHAASDARRSVHFERAATHYGRVLELSKHPNWRLLALAGLLDVNGPQGLNRPAAAERYARMLVAEDPQNIGNYSNLVRVLEEARKYDELAAVFDQARTAMATDADSVSTYGGMVHDLVVFSDGFPRDTGSSLLADAVTLGDQALATHGRTEKLLRTRGMLLRAQAGLEPDRARQRALSEASQAAFDELDRLVK